MANNLDLKVAAARVQVASEYVKLADSTLWPQVNLLARGGGEMGGDASGLNGVGLYANWELDLWGRVRSARAATEATYGSAVADAEYARQSVAALVAKAYFLAVEASLQLRLARRHGRDVAATGHVCRTASTHRQGRWLRLGDCAWQSRDLARHRREADAVARAGTARARGAGRTLSGSGRRALQPSWCSRRGQFRLACRRNCWNGVRTSLQLTGVSPLRSTASRKPRRPGCRASR